VGVDVGGRVPLVLPSTVSTEASPALEPAEAPRTDYVEIARALGGEVLAPARPSGPFGGLEEGTRRLGYWHLAWRARRRRPSVVVSCSEKIGMCVSLLAPRGPGHVVIAHNLTTPRRRAFQDRTRWLQKTDRVVVLARMQEAYQRDEVGLEPDWVRSVHDAVDHRFFTLQGGTEEGSVLSVGAGGARLPHAVGGDLPDRCPDRARRFQQLDAGGRSTEDGSARARDGAPWSTLRRPARAV
jgi:hypothetical protein